MKLKTYVAYCVVTTAYLLAWILMWQLGCTITVIALLVWVTFQIADDYV